MELDDPRLRLGCVAALFVVMSPFFYLGYLAFRDAGSPPDPEEGTGAHVEYLLHRKKDPEAALAESRALLASGAASGERGDLEDQLRRCLEAVYGLRREARDWPGCEAVRDEIVRDHAGSSQADRVDRHWMADLGHWIEESLAADDLDLADRLAKERIAHPRWRPVSWDDPVFEALARIWRREMDRGDLEAAERTLALPLADEKFRQGANRLQREYRQFHELAFAIALGSGDAAVADRRFDALADAARSEGRLDLEPYREYLAQRLGRLDPEESRRLFDTLHGIASESRQKKERILGPLYMALREASWRRAFEAGDDDAVLRAFADTGAHPYYVDHRVQSAQEAEYRLLRWRRDRDPEQLAIVLERHSSRIEPSTLAGALRETWPADELLARGDALLEEGNPDAALACFTAAGADGQDERLDRCTLLSARQAARSGSKWADLASFARAGRLYETLLFERSSFAADRTRWRAAAVELMKMELEWARRAADNQVFEEAEAALSRAVRRTAVAIWREDTTAAGTDLWAGVPAEIRARVEAPDPDAAREALADLASRGRWEVPQAALARETAALVAQAAAMAQVDEAWMHLEWPTRHGESMATFRNVLRKYPGSRAAARVRELLEGAISRDGGVVRLYAEAGDLTNENAVTKFSRLCEYLAFYVAEFEPPGPEDPFRENLRSLLSDAAVLARAIPLVRAFLLSLLADAFPGDETGQVAREEVLRIGLSVMGSLPPRAPGGRSAEFPSLVPGHSAIALENQMPYHLLLFARGPETFYARLDPYSRGSIVLADGRYDVAVIVPTGEVRPYRGEARYEGVIRAEGYVIESAEGKVLHDARDITTDYRLLRAPASAGPVRVHPDSGIVLPR